MNHLDRIELMISASQDFLYSVQRNDAPDIELFYQIQAEQTEALNHLNPVPNHHPQATVIASRIEYLLSLNEEIKGVIQQLMNDIKLQLAQNQTNRKTLTGYQQSVIGTNRGVWRGQG
jgi:hypothetical protein